MKKHIIALIVFASILLMLPVNNVYAAKLNKQIITLEEGATFKLNILDSNSSVEWSSSDKNIATISNTGIVTAVSSGSTKVIAQVNGTQYICTVNVVDSNVIRFTTSSATEIYAKCMPSVLHITHSNGGGSGFFIENNKIVTNYHVIKDATSLDMVDFADKHYTVNRILGYSEDFDIAIIETKEKGNPITKNTHTLIPGETVYTLGCPFGIPFVIAQGLLGKEDWVIDNRHTVMHTSPMSSGSSGGPLVNAYGEVIGINTLSSSGENAQLLNYSVKIEEVDKVDTSKPMTMEEFVDRDNLPITIVNTSKAKIGDYVVFGKYEQDNNTKNGKENIEWLVIGDDGNGHLLVVSRYCLDITCWNSDNKFVEYKDSEHKKWLNNSFYKGAFTEEEKSKIVSVNTNDKITSPKSSGSDYVFLMSIDEINKYFTDIDKRASASKYCKARGAGDFGNKYTFWSTRTPSTSEEGKYFTVAVFGDITSDNPDGVSVVGHMTTRPAMWINK